MDDLLAKAASETRAEEVNMSRFNQWYKLITRYEWSSFFYSQADHFVALTTMTRLCFLRCTLIIDASGIQRRNTLLSSNSWVLYIRGHRCSRHAIFDQTCVHSASIRQKFMWASGFCSSFVSDLCTFTIRSPQEVMQQEGQNFQITKCVVAAAFLRKSKTCDTDNSQSIIFDFCTRVFHGSRLIVVSLFGRYLTSQITFTKSQDLLSWVRHSRASIRTSPIAARTFRANPFVRNLNWSAPGCRLCQIP